ncbi:MAG: TlpA disulfide reductase family protein [Cyclobacteriaceae bacterium]
MMKSVFILLMLFFVTAVNVEAQKAEVIKIGDLEEVIARKSDKITVINFWATWCAPCIKELPFFEKLNATRNDVDINLVSVDMDLDPDPAKVYRFIDRKKLKSRVLILNEDNPNEWIDKIEKSWSGAIPATLVVNSQNGKRSFAASELKEGELEELIESVK